MILVGSGRGGHRRSGDGDEAVSLAAELHPDVVLLDIWLPGVDGLTATAQLAHLPRSRPYWY